MHRDPTEILALAHEEAAKHLQNGCVRDSSVIDRVETVCTCDTNRACTRLLLACALAKVHNPGVDIRKPYANCKCKLRSIIRIYPHSEGIVAPE